GTTSLASQRPLVKTASVTAGLKCPPEMWPPAYTITISAEPMARGAITQGAAGMTVQPTVNTRKKVPINSATYFLISALRRQTGANATCLASLFGERQFPAR